GRHRWGRARRCLTPPEDGRRRRCPSAGVSSSCSRRPALRFPPAPARGSGRREPSTFSTLFPSPLEGVILRMDTTTHSDPAGLEVPDGYRLARIPVEQLDHFPGNVREDYQLSEAFLASLAAELQ